MVLSAFEMYKIHTQGIKLRDIKLVIDGRTISKHFHLSMNVLKHLYKSDCLAVKATNILKFLHNCMHSIR